MIKQGSKEWFEQRVGKITGSRAGAILGRNPWQTSENVLRTMVREFHGAPSEFSGNVATSWGNVNEPNAIFELEIEHSVEVSETGFHTHPEHLWLGASPDGLIGEIAVVEIKAPYSLRNGGEFKSLKEQPHYYDQVQVEMACTNRRECYFFQWSPSGNKLEMVDLDEKWLDENIPKLYEFYKEYLKAIENPDEYLEDLVRIVPDSVHADNYLSAKLRYEEAKSEMEDARENLIKLANGKKTKIGELLVYPVERSGTVSYSKAFKDLMPDADLEKYKSKSSTTWRIK